MDENDNQSAAHTAAGAEQHSQTLPARTNGGTFAPGASGNPGGRPLGARNKATLLARSLLDQCTREITVRAITMARDGDPLALKLCFERILPRRRDVAITLDLPPVESAADCTKAITAIIAAAAAGELTPEEARAMVALVEGQRRGAEVDEFERRLTAVEARTATDAGARASDSGGAKP